MAEGDLQWEFSLEAAYNQLKDGNHFGLEHPAGAETWSKDSTQQLLQRPDVALVTFDQCQLGLKVTDSEKTSRKSTKIATSNPWLALKLAQAQCDRQHEHQPLEGNLTSRAQVYPPALCQAIAHSTLELITRTERLSLCQWVPDENCHSPCPCHSSLNFFEDGDEEGAEEDERPSNTEELMPPLSSSQRRLVHKVHVNTGHPDRTRMLRALKAAGAKPQVLKYVRDEFQCEDCNLKQLPDNRRRAQLPRTFSFNKVLSIDFFYINFQGKRVPILNMVCVGTSYQVAVRAPIPEGSQGSTPTSSMAWKLFVESWMRYFGAPQVVICDAGNEFKAIFERNLELAGIYQHIIHVETPWER